MPAIEGAALDTAVEPDLTRERIHARERAAESGLAFVDLHATEVDAAATLLLSPFTAQTFSALAIGFFDGTPIVAIADPTDDQALERLRSILGTAAYFVVAARSEIEQAFEARLRGPQTPNSPTPRQVGFEPAGATGSAPVARNGERPPPEELESRQLPRSRFAVSLRLVSGERVGVGTFPDEDAAERCAEALIKDLSADDGTRWPRVGGRFVRPAAIASVDVDAISPGSPSSRSRDPES
jgi:hypothetical protein